MVLGSYLLQLSNSSKHFGSKFSGAERTVYYQLLHPFCTVGVHGSTLPFSLRQRFFSLPVREQTTDPKQVGSSCCYQVAGIG